MPSYFKTILLTFSILFMQPLVNTDGVSFAQDRTVVRVVMFSCTHCAQPWLLPESLKDSGLDIETIQAAFATSNVNVGISERGQDFMLKSGTTANG